MKIKKRYLTLIEIIVAFALASILITTLLGIYFQVEMTHQQIVEMRKKTFKNLFVQHRLNAILPKSELKHGNDTYWFYTSTENDYPSLIFVYNNGVDGNPSFANRILAKLFIDQKKQLILATWPLPKKNFDINAPMRKEVLYNNVETLRFSFYNPPHREREDKKIEIPSDFKENQWHSFWPLTQNFLPPIMRIEIVQPETITFTFSLPNSEQTVLYNQ